jgi:hypothetical protein
VEFELSHLKLFSPDEVLTYWWVDHDFAGEFGVEYSSDAARELRRILPHGARVDYEADLVTVRISRKANVVPTLATIYERLGWDQTELAELEPRVHSFKRPRPHRVAIGDVFLIPVAEDLFALGQVLDVHDIQQTIAVFPRLGREADLKPALVEQAKPLTILHVIGVSLLKGEWRVIGSERVRLDPSSGPGGKLYEVGSRSYGNDWPVVPLLRANAGLAPWDRERLRDLVML